MSRTGSGEATITLDYIQLRTDAATPGTPVINGTGGPGGDGLASADAYATLLKPVLADRDYVFFSQRGTHFADPFLECPEYAQAYADDWAAGVPAEERNTHRAEVLRACADAATAAGTDVSAINSVENAADVVALADHLGYDRFFFAGQSYGTMLGQFLLRDHADRVAGVVLDGVVDVTPTSWDQAGPALYQDRFRANFAGCAADPACAAQYPDPEAELVTIFDAANAQPFPVTIVLDDKPVTVKVDGTLLMRALFLSLYTTDGVASLPRTIHLIAEGFTGAIADGATSYIAPAEFGYLMHHAVACTDDPVTEIPDWSAFLAPYVASAVENANEYLHACKDLALTQLPDASDTAITTDVPALLLSGGLDPVTPPSEAAAVAEGFTHQTQVTFPSGTHIQLSKPGISACAVSLMATFFTDPAAALDTSCVSQTPGVPTHVVDQTATAPGVDGTNDVSVTLSSEYLAVEGQPIWVSKDDARYVAVASMPVGTSATDAVTAAQALLIFLAYTGPFEASGTGRAGDHDATLYGGIGTAQNHPAVVKAAIVEDPSGTYVLLGMAIGQAMGTFEHVDMPLALRSFAVGGAPTPSGGAPGSAAPPAPSASAP